MGTLGYYTARARQLSPGGAAKIAARRALRTAKQWLYRSAHGIGDAELLESLGARTPGELAEACLVPRPEAWCDVSRRDGTVAALFELPLAAERAWARAERALSRTYRLFEREVCFGERGAIDWSQDPGSGYRYPEVPSNSLELFPPGVDPKYPWQLARLEGAIALGQGYWLAQTKEAKQRFAEELVALVSDFLRANPPNVGLHWTNAMEVSLRAANLAQALYLVRDAEAVREPGFLLGALRGLCEHTAFVEANLEDKAQVPNNHLIADHVGLLVVGLLFPGLPEAPRQVALAAKGLREQVALQVHEDGVSFEGSTGYHRLVAEGCVLAAHFARGLGVELGATFYQRTHGLLRTAPLWCSEKGWAAQIGDNDSGRVLALTERPALEHRYLGNLGAVMFADGSLKKSEDDFCAEAAWLQGAEGLRVFDALPVARDPLPSFSSPKGGIHVLRGPGAMVVLSAGPQGQRGVGGHCHHDKLSFELHLDGEPAIVDPGSPAYARDPAERNAYRSTLAHNAVVVDGAEQGEFDGERLFLLPEAARAKVDRFESGPRREVVSAVHHGYERLKEPATVRRTLTLDKDAGALIVEELLEGRGEHALETFLQFPDTQVRLRGPRGRERLQALKVLEDASLDESVVVELGPIDAPRAVIVIESGAEVSLEQSAYSPGYGERIPAVRLALRMRRRLPLRWRWAVLFGR